MLGRLFGKQIPLSGTSKAVVKEEFEIFDFFLTNKKKRLIQEQKEQERKDRTNRLCKRMGFIEKLLPDTIPLTEEQFKTFVEQTIATEHSRRILDGLTAQNAATAPAQGAGFAERGRGSTTLPLASLGVTAPLFCQWTRGYVRAVLKRA